ncbi:MAG: NAD-binding protein [Bilophila wadsworthia]
MLRDNNLDVVVVEMNIDTVRQVSALGEKIIYGDATQREVLLHAGAEEAEGLIISSSSAPAGEIVEVARAINPNLRIVHTTYLRGGKPQVRGRISRLLRRT